MGLIREAWKGDAPLWKVFWLYYVLGFILLSFVLEWVAEQGQIGLIVYGVVTLVYGIWVLVALWRCAFNAEWTFFSWLVRIWLGISLVLFLIALVLGGPAAILMFGKMAECRQHMEQQAAAQKVDLKTFQQQHPGLLKQCVEAPATDNVAQPTPPVSRYAQCRETLRQNAITNNTDPDTYVAQNQAWLGQCEKGQP